MSISDTTPNKLFSLAVAAMLSLGLAGAVSGATRANPDPGNYEWSAKLVSYDAATNTLTFAISGGAASLCEAIIKWTQSQ